MFRLKGIAAALVAVLIVPLFAAAAPAQAAYSCNVTVPSRVSITSPYKAITARYSNGCLTHAEWATWDVVHPTQGLADILIYDGTSSTEIMDWYDWEPRGTYTVRPDGAWDDNYDDLAQNSPRMSVRLGSYTYVTHSRSGKYVRADTKVTRYSTSARKMRPYAGARVTLRFRNSTSGPWTSSRTAKTNSKGKVTFRVSSSRARYWQVSTSDTSTTWGGRTTFRR
ncbi:hypothetical protein [Kribbia dieselivorans]|uniref:hypothetical protein n=1 Tax=Kribbia dieselivorans TaxID=331526 RepID=UPI000838B86D|nr:hypothetical protein [Kribbia dieselivorans]